MIINYRIESHLIKGNKVLDELSFCAKNFYNQAMFKVRQKFLETSKQKEKGLIKDAIYLNYDEIEKEMKGIEEYKILSAQTRQSILKLLDKNWRSFFKSIKEWKINISKFTGKPGIPKYLDKQGRFALLYPGQNIPIKDGYLNIPKTSIKVKTKVSKENLREVRIVPLGNKCFKITVVYRKEFTDLNLDRNNVIGIDIGLNNLMAITSNQTSGFCCLVNGRPLKSINQYYNKTITEIKSKLKIINNKDWSNKLNSITLKRKFKIDDYMHKVSNKLIQLCNEFNIGKMIIGHNNGWKQEINLGTKTNQNFVQIPFNRLIQMIQYKAEEIGIIVELVEESYTSKCDHLVNESMEHHEVYLGKRIKRGLFKSSVGLYLNADLNAALGILRKAKVSCEDFFSEIIASRGCVLQPIKLSC